MRTQIESIWFVWRRSQSSLDTHRRLTKIAFPIATTLKLSIQAIELNRSIFNISFLVDARLKSVPRSFIYAKVRADKILPGGRLTWLSKHSRCFYRFFFACRIRGWLEKCVSNVISYWTILVMFLDFSPVWKELSRSSDDDTTKANAPERPPQ